MWLRTIDKHKYGSLIKFIEVPGRVVLTRLLTNVKDCVFSNCFFFIHERKLYLHIGHSFLFATTVYVVACF